MFHKYCNLHFCCAQMLFAEMERLSVPLEGLVYLGGLIHSVEGVSTSPLCVTVYKTVLVALMKWTVDSVRPSLL